MTSFLAATIYQGNRDRNHKLYNSVSAESTLYTTAGMFIGKIDIFCVVKFSSNHSMYEAYSCVCGILSFKLNGMDAVNIITKLVSERISFICIVEREIKYPGEFLSCFLEKPCIKSVSC